MLTRVHVAYYTVIMTCVHLCMYQNVREYLRAMHVHVYV